MGYFGTTRIGGGKLTMNSDKRTEIKLLLHKNVNDYPVAWSLQHGYTKLPEWMTYETAGGLRLNKMMASGEADMGKMAIPAFAKAIEAGIDLKIISTYVITPLSGIFTPKGSGVTIENLKGKEFTLGAEEYTTTSVLLGVLKEKFGIQKDEIKVKVVPACPIIYRALKKRTTDVGILCPGGYLRGLVDSSLEVILNHHEAYNELYGSYPVVALLVVKSGLLNDPRIKETVEVLKASEKKGNENVTDMVDDYQEYCHCGEMKKEFAPYVLKGQRDNNNHTMFESLTEANKKSIEQIWKFAHEFGYINRIPVMEKVIAPIIS